MDTKIITAADPAATLDGFCRHTGIGSWFVVTDSNVADALAPMFARSEILSASPRFAVAPGEENKSPRTLIEIWQWLSDSGATRHSGVINVGGGMVTDMGGFAAATFKRGIPYVNLPTTLLGAVDASIGGKTAVNLGVLKNEVGAFAPPMATLLSAAPFATLPGTEMLSGYAEMLKTALLRSADFYHSLLDIDAVLSDAAALEEVVRKCVEFKKSVTDGDLREGGRRKILNLGHTAGHAFEALAREKGGMVPHGVAVSYGVLTSMILSHISLGFSSAELQKYASAVLRQYYPPLRITCDDYPRLLQLMGHDKKNAETGHPRFVLLEAIGCPVIDVEVSPDNVLAALDITRDLTGR